MAVPALSAVERDLLDPAWLALSLPRASSPERDARAFWHSVSLARLCLRAGWPAQARAALRAVALAGSEWPPVSRRAGTALIELHAGIAVAEAISAFDLA
ncbi:hypothetical protein EEDFHM_00057 [Methylorubrum populi]